MRSHTPISTNAIDKLVDYDKKTTRQETELGEYPTPKLINYETANFDSSNYKREKKNLRELLDAIIPPKSVDGKDSQVSMSQCTREQIKEQWKRLDFLLQLRQARETGMCPVREEVYSAMFDELIRQVTINCPERGLLLSRCRDESRLTISAYQTLYETSLGYGARKSIEAQDSLVDIQADVGNKLKEKEELLKKVEGLENEYELREKRLAEQRNILNKQYNERKEFLKNQKKHLESYLRTQKEQNGEA